VDVQYEQKYEETKKVVLVDSTKCFNK